MRNKIQKFFAIVGN